VKDALRVAALLALVAVAAWKFVDLQGAKGYALRAGEPAPPLRLPALDGRELDLATLRGRVVLVNFWATWCPPCVTELPSLERLHRALAASGLVLVSVSADEDESALRRFVAERGITFPVLRDPGGRTAAREYRTTGYPESFVVDGRGVLLEHHVGPAEWDTPAALDHFRELLASRSAAPTR
jgi:peroxiredoxin